MYPKIVALDADGTIWKGWLNQNVFGIDDNLEPVGEWALRNRRNYNNKIILSNDVPSIVSDILKNGAQLAIVSRNTSKNLCDRALWYFKTTNPRNGQRTPIIEMVKFDEVYDLPKTVHFKRIQGWSQSEYCDMILFDDQAENNIVERLLGVTVQVLSTKEGLTWNDYRKGIAVWRRNKRIRSPYLGRGIMLYPNRKLIGYAGMERDTFQLVQSGKRRVNYTHPARWGYALYITDDPAIARFFAEWMRSFSAPPKQTFVCSLWARDGLIFDNLPKIWMPEMDKYLSNNSQWSASKTAWSQEIRDRLIEDRYGVQKPYILFSKHKRMPGMPIPNGTRCNEMVVYPQIQDALLMAIQMSEQEVQSKIDHMSWSDRYDQKKERWNITVPNITLDDLKGHK